MSGDRADAIEAMTLAECRYHLRTGGVGILALRDAWSPILRPVNFVLHDESIVIRTGEGQILRAATAAEPASFVISEIDRQEHAGWSVIVSGKLIEQSCVGPLSSVALQSWAGADRQHIIGLSIDELSGRYIADEPMRD